MNREILFQIWDKEKKRMSKPLPVFWPFIQWSDGDIDMPTDFAISREERFVFRQYTGISDKNNQKIYEGDIILVNGEKRMPVVYENACFRTPYNTSNYRLGGWEQTAIEVIGNKFLNPELIPTK